LLGGIGTHMNNNFSLVMMSLLRQAYFWFGYML
jgi:hypothetical protein